MFGSVVVDVAIGMVFVFLLLSLMASTIHEFLATVVQARATNLYRGMFSLFSGGQFYSGEELEVGVSFVEKIYTHGLVQGLYRSDKADFAGLDLVHLLNQRIESQVEKSARLARPLARLIAAIAAVRQFLLKVLTRWMRVAWVPTAAWKQDISSLPSYIPSRTFALALVSILNVGKKSGPSVVAEVRDYLSAAHSKHPEDKTIEALLALSIDAEDSVPRLQGNFENWYNDAMDRVSGWYKKNTQYVLLGIGLLLAVILNVNSIEVAQTLWFDRDLRTTLVDQVDKMHDQLPPRVAASQTDRDNLTVKLGSDLQTFRGATASLFPVGWHHRPTLPWQSDGMHHPGEWVLRAISVLAGWMITALAISLGAPFWFDLLNKFMVVRGTVKPQEKSQREASKDGSPSP